jgi:hypothetical protein
VTPPYQIQNATTTTLSNIKTTNVKDTFTLSDPIRSIFYVHNIKNVSNIVNITGQFDTMSKFIISDN